MCSVLSNEALLQVILVAPQILERKMEGPATNTANIATTAANTATTTHTTT